jgi:hypothetical protein
MDYRDDSPLYRAKMRRAQARDMMQQAVDIAKWRLSPDHLRSDAKAKGDQILSAIKAKPMQLVRKNPAWLAGSAALIGLWIFRKPIAKALPDVAQGMREGADALFAKMSQQMNGSQDQMKDEYREGTD